MGSAPGSRHHGHRKLGAELQPDEVEAITAFLTSLTGEQAVIEYPILPVQASSTPRPTADIIVRQAVRERSPPSPCRRNPHQLSRPGG